MGYNLSRKTDELGKKHKSRLWQKIVGILACIVVFCTTYALILPAITMENTPYCGKEEHQHTEDCYSQKLICGKEESTLPVHTHTEDCYTETQVLTCNEDTAAADTADAFSDGNNVSAENSTSGHTHTEECYDADGNLTCGQEESTGHTHTDAYYSYEKVLSCGLAENSVEPHTHTADCYEEELTCGKEEHTHSLACYSNPEADTEESDDWEATIPQSLEGTRAENLIAVAESQLGYQESTKNYAAPDGMTKHGYTRYGAWYGDPYGDWTVTFISFCLNYAGIPQSAVPYGSDYSAWLTDLESAGLYAAAGTYTPQAGDLLLFTQDLAAVITNVNTDTDGNVTTLDIIVGDSNDAVESHNIDVDSVSVRGFAKLSADSAAATATETATVTATTIETATVTETATDVTTTTESETVSTSETVSEITEVQTKAENITETVTKAPVTQTETEKSTVPQTETVKTTETQGQVNDVTEITTEAEKSTKITEETAAESTTETTTVSTTETTTVTTTETTTATTTESETEETTEMSGTDSDDFDESGLSWAFVLADDDEIAVASETNDIVTENWDVQARVGSADDTTGSGDDSSLDDEIMLLSDMAVYSSGTETGVALDEYIQSITVSKLSNGQWVSVDDGVTENDSIRVNINYEVNGGLPGTNNVLTYQLPSNLTFEKAMSGPVMQGGTEVGSYTIETNGLITITLDSNKFDPNRSFVGEIGFKGTITMMGNEDEETISFPGGKAQVVIKKDTSSYDLTTAKTAELSSDLKTISYTVTASSVKGTMGNALTIQDKFSDSYTGDYASGKYQTDTIKLTKIAADGTESQITDKTAEVTQDSEGKYGFVYSDLPALEAGEKYVVTYTADVKEGKNGGGSVKNSAAASTTNKSGTWVYKEVSIPHTMIEKTGSYDKYADCITWTITLNKNETADMSGYVLEDTLPDGISLVENSITLDPLPSGMTVQPTGFPITFPNDSGMTKYTVTYKTTAPSADGTVNNTAQLENDSESYGTTGETGVAHRTESISKKFNSSSTNSDTGKITYYWFTKVEFPEGNLSEIIYKDQILPTKDASGNVKTETDGTNPHYAIASELQNQFTTADGALKLNVPGENGTSTNLSYTEAVNAGYSFEFHYYSDENMTTEISSTDDSSHVGYFTVKVTKKDGDSIKANYLHLKYPTTFDKDIMGDSETWTFANKGIYNNQESEGSHSYTKPAKLEKQVYVKDSNGNFNWLSGNHKIDYADLSDGYLLYRLVIRTSLTDNDDITITDTLSDSGMSYDKDSVKLFFLNPGGDIWGNTGSVGNEWGSGGSDYGCSYWGEHGEWTYYPKESLSTEISEDGMKMTCVIKGGYNADAYGGNCGKAPHSFVLCYKVKIADDTYWQDLTKTEKAYENQASWGNTASSTITRVENREIEKVQKSAKQRQKTLDDGTTVNLDAIDYSVLINPTALDLIENSDEIVLTDNLECASNVKAYLDLASVKLYAYDSTKGDNLGVQLDRSMISVQYDESNLQKPVMTVTVPDNRACVLVYSYSFDTGTNNTSNINNSVTWSGGSSKSDQIQLQDSDSSATVSQSELSIYKVDSEDYSIRLSGAEFALKKYDTASSKFVDETVAPTVGTQKTDESGTYVTGTEGYLRFDCVSDSGLTQNTLYKLTEGNAPKGYTKDGTEYYFVILSKDKTESDLSTTVSAAGASNVKYYSAKTDEIGIYIPNESSSVSVRKVWQDSDGKDVTASKSSGDSVSVTLYRAKKVQSTAETHSVTLTVGSQWSKITLGPYYVKNGESLKVTWCDSWKDYEISSNFTLSDLGITWEVEGGSAYGKPIFTTPGGVSSDVTYSIIASYCGGSTASAFDVSYNTVMELQDKTKVEETNITNPVTLNSDNDWMYTWSGLEEKDSNGNLYYYSIEENNVPSGYTVSYVNNNGIQVGAGEMVVVNKEDEKHEDYSLPETGGSGTNWYTFGGLLLMLASAASLMYKARLERKEGR